LAEFPGLPIMYTVDNGVTWSEYKQGVTLLSDDMCKNSDLQMVTK